MPGLTPEQEEKLAQINSTEGGQSLSSAQKAHLVKFGTIEIKGEKPSPDMDIGPLKRMGEDLPTTEIGQGPKMTPKPRTMGSE